MKDLRFKSPERIGGRQKRKEIKITYVHNDSMKKEQNQED